MQLFTCNSMGEVREDAERASEIINQIKKNLDQSSSQIAINSMFQGWGVALNSANKSPHTIKNMISQARKVLDQHLDPREADIMRMFMKLDGSNLGDVKAHELMRVTDRAFGVATYSNVTTYLQVVSKMCKSVDPDICKVGLLAATGRRPAEMTASNFMWEGHKEVRFDGQAKMRSRMVQAGGYIIPTLIEADEVMDAWRRMGSKLLSRSHRQMSSVFDKFMRDVKWPPAIECTPKTLRAMYACMAYHLLAPSNQQEWQFVNEVLGHELDDQATCQTYMRFKFADPEPEEDVIDDEPDAEAS